MAKERPSQEETINLNNFHARLPGGYERVTQNADDVRESLRDVLSRLKAKTQGHSDRRLNKTAQEFFADIDRACAELGLRVEELQEENRRRAELLRQFISEVRLWRQRGMRESEPDDTAAAAANDAFQAKIRPIYEKLLEWGYTHQDLTQ